MEHYGDEGLSSLRSLISAGAWVSAGVLLGRIAGFAREASIAGTFGVSLSADVAILILTLPDVLANILMGGALSAVLIPEFTRLPSNQARRLFYQSSMLVVFTFGAIALVLAWQARPLIRLLAPGLGQEGVELAAGPTSIVVWVVPMTVLAGVTTAYLQAAGRFAVPALGTFIFNSVLVVGMVALLPSRDGLLELGVFAVLAAALRWCSQLLNLPRYEQCGALSRFWLINRSLLVRYLEALASGSLLVLLPVLARAFASYGDVGGIAQMNYANKLVELPLGIGLTVFSVVLFPHLARAFADGDHESAQHMLRRGLTFVFNIALAMTVPLVWFGSEFSQLVFGWGTITESKLHSLGMLASIGFLSLPAQAVSSLLLAAFNAQRDTRTPLVINVLAVAGFTLIGWLAMEAYGVPGVMVVLTLAHWLVVMLQSILLRWCHGISVGHNLFRLSNLCVVAIVLIAYAPIGYLSTFWKGSLATLLLSAVGFVMLTLILMALDSVFREMLLSLWRVRRSA